MQLSLHFMFRNRTFPIGLSKKVVRLTETLLNIINEINDIFMILSVNSLSTARFYSCISGAECISKIEFVFDNLKILA